jgi:PAS domain S-box-containing protein
MKDRTPSQKNGAADRKAGHPPAEQGAWIGSTKREDFVVVLDNLPCGLSVLGSAFGKALFINRQMLDMLGYALTTEPCGTDMAKKAIPDRRMRQEARKEWKRWVEAGGGTEISPWRCGDGKLRFFEIRTVVVRKDFILNAWTDVTDRHEAEVRLRESEVRFRSFFENSTDPFLLLDGEIIVNCNRAALSLFNGGNNEEIIGKTLEFLSPERQGDGRLTKKRLPALLKTALKEGNRRIEWIILSLDKRTIPVEMSMATIKLEGEELLFIVLRDVTPWKEAENVLRNGKMDLEAAVRTKTLELYAANEELSDSREELRHLSEHLQQAREEERTRIAREVHDRVGQFLTGLKMDLVYRTQNPPVRASDLVDQTNRLLDQIDGAIHSVQEICSELRPTILSHFGLTAAIGWYLEEFEKRTGIRCSAKMDSMFPSLHEDLDLLLFRVFQEAMTNVLRHAGATAVAVKLRCHKDAVELMVKDNGRGIPKERIVHPRSFGIIGIRERVRFWGGRADFRRNPKGGTIVTVKLPMDSAVSVRREAKGGSGKKRKNI